MQAGSQPIRRRDKAPSCRWAIQHLCDERVCEPALERLRFWIAIVGAWPLEAAGIDTLLHTAATRTMSIVAMTELRPEGSDEYDPEAPIRPRWARLPSFTNGFAVGRKELFLMAEESGYPGIKRSLKGISKSVSAR